MTTCQSCVVNVPMVANPLGALGEGIGVCHNCNSLACGHHGQRDDDTPRFGCSRCDVPLLVASAAELAPDPSDPIRKVADTYRGGPGFGSWLIQSVDEFRRRRPGYRDWFDPDALSPDTLVARGREFERARGELSDEAAGLLGAAQQLVMSLYPDPDDLPAPLKGLFVGLTA